MSTAHRTSLLERAFNVWMRTLIRVGLGSPHTYLLTVRGRKSGKPHSTPVTLVEENGQRWLVAPYGQVQWAKNARAAGEVTLSRGGRSVKCRIAECGAQEGGEVLKKYLDVEPITQPAFKARRGDPVEAFVAEASSHPVFRLL